MKAAILSILVAGAVLAQAQAQDATPTPSSTAAASLSPSASPSASSSSSSSPLIPSGISSQCTSFLQHLNADPALSTCSAPLLTATSSFASGNATAVDEAALSRLCSSTTNVGCDPDVVRASLSYFAGNCSAELQARNELVVSNYDVLYIILPLHQAVCSTDPTTNNYCALAMPKQSSASSSAASSAIPKPSASLAVNATTNGTGTAAFVQFAVQNAVKAFSLDDLYYTVSNGARSLLKRQSSGDNSTSTANGTTIANTATLPNATTFRNSYLPFLFLNPNQTSTELCTPCTKNIVAAYVSWQTSSPHALGLAHSPLLGNQAKLWRALGNACGSGFLQSVEDKAGTTGLSLGSGSRTLVSSFAVALAGLVIAALVEVV